MKLKVVEEDGFLACQVTDVGGIDDKSFNATAWKGMEDAVADFGIEAKYLESQQQTDYEANINAFLEEGCDLIMSVGFLLGDATAAAAAANPDGSSASWTSIASQLTTCTALDLLSTRPHSWLATWPPE